MLNWVLQDFGRPFLKPVHPNIVHRHGLRENGGGRGVAGPATPYRQVEDDVEGTVEGGTASPDLKGKVTWFSPFS